MTHTIVNGMQPAESPDLFAVSPDGRTILYTVADEEGADLMLVENFH